MNITTRIINMLDVYFTLLKFERAWKHDVLTSIKIKGGGCISFKNKSELTYYREAYERDLMGIANLADSRRVGDIETRREETR